MEGSKINSRVVSGLVVNDRPKQDLKSSEGKILSPVVQNTNYQKSQIIALSDTVRNDSSVGVRFAKSVSFNSLEDAKKFLKGALDMLTQNPDQAEQIYEKALLARNQIKDKKNEEIFKFIVARRAALSCVSSSSCNIGSQELIDLNNLGVTLSRLIFRDIAKLTTEIRAGISRRDSTGLTEKLNIIQGYMNLASTSAIPLPGVKNTFDALRAQVNGLGYDTGDIN